MSRDIGLHALTQYVYTAAARVLCILATVAGVSSATTADPGSRARDVICCASQRAPVIFLPPFHSPIC